MKIIYEEFGLERRLRRRRQAGDQEKERNQDGDVEDADLRMDTAVSIGDVYIDEWEVLPNVQDRHNWVHKQLLP